MSLINEIKNIKYKIFYKKSSKIKSDLQLIKKRLTGNHNILYNKGKVFFCKAMEKISFFSTIFIACTLISMTAYSVYIGFGPNSTNLRDPFEEHED